MASAPPASAAGRSTEATSTAPPPSAASARSGKSAATQGTGIAIASIPPRGPSRGGSVVPSSNGTPVPGSRRAGDTAQLDPRENPWDIEPPRWTQADRWEEQATRADWEGTARQVEHLHDDAWWMNDPNLGYPTGEAPPKWTPAQEARSSKNKRPSGTEVTISPHPSVPTIPSVSGNASSG
eukprot:gene47947-23763_t